MQWRDSQRTLLAEDDEQAGDRVSGEDETCVRVEAAVIVTLAGLIPVPFPSAGSFWIW